MSAAPVFHQPPGAARPAPPASLPAVTLLGVRLHALTERQTIDRVLSELAASRGGWVVTPNLDILRRCVREKTMRDLAHRATLVVPDGMPLIWASRLQGDPLPERVAGSTLVVTLSEAAARAGRSVFLLGGAPGVAEQAERALRERLPGLRVAGSHCPPMGFEKDEAQLRAIERAVRAAAPDIVYVALGSPKQEQLIDRLRGEFPNAWFLGVGISLSFLCGEVKRAPRWMQRIGLEWFHRFTQEPRRLARRYFIDGVPFAIELLTRATLARFAHRPAPAQDSSP
jgi:N-acetylglucosaminyldiphosphoundecaprenol N-acetyl-beta-D-mannosaminyltransferase